MTSLDFIAVCIDLSQKDEGKRAEKCCSFTVNSVHGVGRMKSNR